MYTRRQEFQKHWFDIKVSGITIGEWCRPIIGQPGKVHCSHCGVTIKYGSIGIRALRDHAATKRHIHNRKSSLVSECKRSGKVRAVSASLDTGQCSVQRSPIATDTKHNNDTVEENKNENDSIFSSLLGPSTGSEYKNRFVEVFICFFCGEEFSSRNLLQGHQLCCTLKPPQLQAVVPQASAVHTLDDDSPPSLLPPPLYCHSLDSVKQLSTTDKSAQNLPQTPPTADFISALGLLPKSKEFQICKKRRNTQCESIDLEEDLPLSPSMPRTPKLLISHLSRENNEASAVTGSFPLRRRISLFSQQSRDGKVGNEDKEIDEEGKIKEKRRMTITKSLYNLDITSPLGQFLIKYFKGDPSLHVLSDIESHCRTCAMPKKTATASRLRERRLIYPTTFRGYSKSHTQHFHLYKFNRSQTKEFLRRISTRLDKPSIALLRTMKKCFVKLRRITKAVLKRWLLCPEDITVDLKPLTKKEISFWTSPKPSANSDELPAIFPSGLNFSSPNVNDVLGLRVRGNVAFPKRAKLSLSNYVSEETFAEIIKNRRTIYRSLLLDTKGFDSGSSEEENVPKNMSSCMCVLRRMLSSPSLYPVHRREGSTLPDITNLGFDLRARSASTAQHDHCTSTPTQSGDSCTDQEASLKTVDVSRGERSVMRHTRAGLPVPVVTGKSSESPQTSNNPRHNGKHSVSVRCAFEGEVIDCCLGDREKLHSAFNNKMDASGSERSPQQKLDLVNMKKRARDEYKKDLTFPEERSNQSEVDSHTTSAKCESTVGKAPAFSVPLGQQKKIDCSLDKCLKVANVLKVAMRRLSRGHGKFTSPETNGSNYHISNPCQANNDDDDEYSAFKVNGDDHCMSILHEPKNCTRNVAGQGGPPRKDMRTWSDFEKKLMAAGLVRRRGEPNSTESQWVLKGDRATVPLRDDAIQGEFGHKREEEEMSIPPVKLIRCRNANGIPKRKCPQRLSDKGISQKKIRKMKRDNVGKRSLRKSNSGASVSSKYSRPKLEKKEQLHEGLKLRRSNLLIHHSPRLRPCMNTSMSIAQRAEERKSLLVSFHLDYDQDRKSILKSGRMVKTKLGGSSGVVNRQGCRIRES